jgi:hypothetical protein
MTDKTKHETPSHGNYERQDLAPSGVLYFLVTLGVATILCLFGLRGLYAYLDHRERSLQPAVSPLLTNVPADTRHIAPGYPQAAFPSPKLEEDERGQLNGILLNEEQKLYSYGWMDEKAGTIHIPIERAMDLIVERGLPVRPQGVGSDNAATVSGASRKESNKTAAGKKGETQ